MFAPPPRARAAPSPIYAPQLAEARLEAKAAANAARRDRFLDAKQRLIGADRAALDMLVSERQQQQELDKERERLYDRANAHVMSKLADADRAHRRVRRAQEVACMQHNKLLLEAPDRARQEREDRRREADQRIVFVGEDLAKDARERRQRQQVRSWVEQQVFERAGKDDAAQAQAAEWGCHQKKVAEHMRSVEDAQAKERAEYARSVAQYNVSAAEARRGDSVAKQAQLEVEQSFAERLEGASEAPTCTDYKGDLDGRLRKSMVAFNERATAEKEKRAREVLAEKNSLAGVGEQVRRAVVQNGRDEQRLRREMQRAVLLENQQLAAQRRQREAFEQSVRCGGPSSDFFRGFGTSCR